MAVSINALQAVQIANQTRLLNGGAEAWGQKVRVSFVKSTTAYPYVLQFWAGGGHDQSIRTRDATLRMGVKAVSDKMDDALKAAERIAATSGQSSSAVRLIQLVSRV